MHTSEIFPNCNQIWRQLGLYNQPMHTYQRSWRMVSWCSSTICKHRMPIVWWFPACRIPHPSGLYTQKECLRFNFFDARHDYSSQIMAILECLCFDPFDSIMTNYLNDLAMTTECTCTDQRDVSTHGNMCCFIGNNFAIFAPEGVSDYYIITTRGRHINTWRMIPGGGDRSYWPVWEDSATLQQLLTTCYNKYEDEATCVRLHSSSFCVREKISFPPDLCRTLRATSDLTPTCPNRHHQKVVTKIAHR